MSKTIEPCSDPISAERSPDRRSAPKFPRGAGSIVAACSAAALLLASGMAIAQEACTQMQVYLAIAPNHREDVMAYIAPRLKQKFNVDLVTEAIGSVMMVDRLTAQAANPRVTIVQWDVPVGIAACDKGQCASIDPEKAPNLKKLPTWAQSRDSAGNVTVLDRGSGRGRHSL